MYEENTVAVVIPAFNEAGFVGEVIDTIPEFVDRIYPVDDCSTDATWAEIRAHARRANEQSAGPVADGAGDLLPPDDAEPPESESSAGGSSARGSSESESPGSDESLAAPRVVPLRHDENRGVGAAIKTGYRRASADGIDAVAVMAGDGQMDPNYLPRILDPVVSGRADYAKGDRLALDEFTDEMSNWRLFGNGLLTLLTRAASGYWSMTDPQNGYTAITSEALDRLDLDSVFDDYGFANAMLVHLNVADMRVADVPMPARYGDEDSGIRYSTFVPQLSALLAKGFAWRLAEKHLRREVRAVPLLYAVGVVGTLAGVYATVRDSLRGSKAVSEETAGSDETSATTGSDEASGSAETGATTGSTGADAPLGASAPDQSNIAYRKENKYNAKTFKEDSQTTMNTATTERPRGRGPLTMLVGLAATALAVVFDAAENEPLHVTLESDDPAETEEGRPESDREVSDR